MKWFRFIPVLMMSGFVSGFSQANYEVRLDTSNCASVFRGASVVSDKVAWVCGSKATVGLTTDGGSSWSFFSVLDDDKAEIRDIEAWDDQNAVVISVRNPAQILRTTDGGKTWTPVFTDGSHRMFLDGMAWWDKERGIAYGDPVKGKFVVITTTDGGVTWEELPEEKRPAAMEGEAGFAASGTGIRTGKGGVVWFASGGAASNVYLSHDYGHTWYKHGTPVVTGMGSKGINSLAFLDEHTGIAVGGDFTAPDNKEENYAWTSDGGKTWTRDAGTSHPAGYRSCVEYISKTTVVATGRTGTDISLDGGKNWQNIHKTDFNVVAKSKKGKWILLAGAHKIGRLLIR